MYQNKHVLVIGLGLSGQSAAHFLLDRGAKVMAVDRKADILEQQPEAAILKSKGMALTFDHKLTGKDVSQFDLIVVSPGVPQTHPLCLAARQFAIPIIGEIELACRGLINPVLGITGTNGKTTVTMLVTHVLNHCGHTARALGNVGVPLAQELSQVKPEDVLVLELSSYQLETFSQPVLNGGVILNITPDHLDRYIHMDAYAEAKCQIAKALKPGAFLYVTAEVFESYKHYLPEHVKQYGYLSQQFIFTDGRHLYRDGAIECELPAQYQGKRSHDVENFLAAYALCRDCGIDPQDFCRAFQSFKKPPHRIEFVLEKDGAKYYDDSKGTNLDAVMRAVQSLQGPIVLIAGGVDKGAPYTPWLDSFANRVKCICAIGQAASKIYAQLSHQVPVKLFENLEDAVHYAAQIAKSGDNVLLSPGCASFDMFRDYAHRGEEFQRIVRAL